MPVTWNPNRPNVGSFPTSAPQTAPQTQKLAPAADPSTVDAEGNYIGKDYSGLSTGSQESSFEVREAKEEAEKVAKIEEEKYPEGLEELPQDELNEIKEKRDDWIQANGSSIRKTKEALNKAIIEAEKSGDDDKLEELLRIKSQVEIREMQNSSIESSIKQACSQAEDQEKKLRNVNG